MRKSIHSNSRGQSGAVLITALILLLVLTILGVSTMGTAKMEMSMAANDQFLENAFQAAESGLDTTLAGLRAETIAAPPPGNPGDCALPGVVVNVPALNATHQTTLCYVGDGLAFDLSGLGFTTFNYQANTQAIAQGNASSLHSLGLKKLGPAFE